MLLVPFTCGWTGTRKAPVLPVYSGNSPNTHRALHTASGRSESILRPSACAVNTVMERKYVPFPIDCSLAGGRLPAPSIASGGDHTDQHH